MAAACDADDACTAFSHMHGLQTGSGAGASSSMFTQSPCRGLYTRVLGALPSEVEALDQLLCGDNTYCTTPPTYISSSASTSANEALDITVTITAPMQTPPRLLNPSQGTIDALPRLLRVSRLRIACSGGGRLTGGLPRHLLRVTPRLTRLVMAGCGLADVLPQDWATLAPPSLRALDLSDNALRGPLPAAWALDPTSASPSSASHTLGLAHLNLSRNSLTGPIPAGWWQGVLARSSGGYDDQDVAASPMLADLQHNQLSGPVDMRIVREACGLRDVALYFAAVAASWVSGREAGATPVLLLGGNSGLAQWAGKYDRLQGKRVYTPDDHQDNMCGNYWYIVHIMVLWGCFVLALAAIAVWAVLAVRAKRKAAALKAHRREQARLARIAQLQQQQQAANQAAAAAVAKMQVQQQQAAAAQASAAQQQQQQQQAAAQPQAQPAQAPIAAAQQQAIAQATQAALQMAASVAAPPAQPQQAQQQQQPAQQHHQPMVVDLASISPETTPPPELPPATP
uniref:Leucine-rich repeat-containing N-terminal plant-type domain-containing protein n=1 Tax=Chlamydomonas leiostraca TaxID=1034604 RepID=A0A7S0RAG8_9CHLO